MSSQPIKIMVGFICSIELSLFLSNVIFLTVHVLKIKCQHIMMIQGVLLASLLLVIVPQLAQLVITHRAAQDQWLLRLRSIRS